MSSDDPLWKTLHHHRDAPHWWLALSGGLDSMVLLHRLAAASKQAVFPALTAVHIHHGLHADADQWAAQCEQTCASVGIACRVLPVTVNAAGKQSIEMAAREARYAALESCLGAGDVLWMAHHQDDQAETMMMRLLRGTGPAGLAGMPSERALGAARLVRPLLDTPRSELEAYARRHQLAWVEDPSNQSLQMDRNFLRHEIFPRLAERWPAYRQGLSRASHWLREQTRIETEALDALLAARQGRDRYGAYLVLDGMAEWSSGLRQALLRHWLAALGLAMPAAARLASLERDVALARVDAVGQWALGDYVFSRFQQRLYAHAAIEVGETGSWSDLSSPFRMNHAMRLAAQAGVGAGHVQHGVTLQVRYRQGGERCRPAGRAHSQTLKHLMQEYAIPPWLRDIVPLLYVGDELAAVGDYWVCAGFEAAKDQKGWKFHWEMAVAN